MEIQRCFICGQDLNKYPTYSQEKCNHNFHTHCIVTWYRIGNNFCPCCNNDIYDFRGRLLNYQKEVCERRVLILKKEKNINKKTKQIIDDLEKIKIQLKEKQTFIWGKKMAYKKYIKDNNLSYKDAIEYKEKNIKDYYRLYAKQITKYKQIMNESTIPIISRSFVDLT